MARGEQILRQWKLLQTLQRRGIGVTLRELSDEFEVSERTIQRDLEMLRELGFPIVYESDPVGKRYWKMPHDFFRSGPLVLSLTEAVSLHLAERFFAPLAGTHFAEALESVLEKIRSLLPAEALEHFRALDETVYVRPPARADYSRYAGTIRLLTESARSQKSVQVRYCSVWRGETYTTLFDPYGMVYYDGDLFCVGRSHRAADVRIFKITRIRKAEPTERTFRRPSGFSLERRFRASFGILARPGKPIEIRVRFRGPAATLVQERVWHESQRLEKLPAERTLFEPHPKRPGDVLARFRLTDVVEFKKWLKGYGDLAEVLSPAWLREQMREELLAAAGLYDDG